MGRVAAGMVMAEPLCLLLGVEVVSIFELSRVMGASVRTIDRHYGHLARDSEQAIRARLNVKRHRSGVLVATGEEE